MCLLFVGCGPNITSGKVIQLKTVPAHIKPGYTTTMLIPAGKSFILMPQVYPEQHIPEKYYIVVQGHDHGKWGIIEIETNSSFKGYKVGDLWKEVK